MAAAKRRGAPFRRTDANGNGDGPSSLFPTGQKAPPVRLLEEGKQQASADSSQASGGGGGAAQLNFVGGSEDCVEFHSAADKRVKELEAKATPAASEEEQ